MTTETFERDCTGCEGTGRRMDHWIKAMMPCAVCEGSGTVAAPWADECEDDILDLMLGAETNLRRTPGDHGNTEALAIFGAALDILRDTESIVGAWERVERMPTRTLTGERAQHEVYELAEKYGKFEQRISCEEVSR